jgi:hypothetical protein
MNEEADKGQKMETSKPISRRQFLTRTSSGLVSMGVFGNTLAQIVSSVDSNLSAVKEKGGVQEKESQSPL